MRKLICFICAMIILSGQVFASENYIPADVAGTEYENAYEILTGLSIFDYNDDSSFRPFTPITRGDFAIALGNIMKSIVTDDNYYFVDVPSDHAAFEAVNKLAGYGVINGTGNGNFNPDENIKAVDAVKMIVASIGYSQTAEYMGSYPNGYLQAANTIGLLKDIEFENNGDLIRGEAAKLLLNSFEIPVVTANLGGKFELNIEEENDFLYATMGIKKIKGIIKANDSYSVDGGEVAPENSLRIDDTVYYGSNQNWSDMVGYSVTCYFCQDDYDENEIVYIQKNVTRTKEITISAKDIESFNFPEFQYNNKETDKIQKIDVSDDLCMIYNNMPKTPIEESDFYPNSGEITFIDSDNSGNYDIVKVNTYRNAIVSNILNDIIYISYPVNGKIVLDDYEVVNLYNTDGTEISVSELKENDVISIYESLDKSLVKIVYSRERVTGSISESYNEYGVNKLVINDKVYDVAHDYDQSVSFLTTMGTEGTFCLDANGDIYTMVGEKVTKRRYGYYIRSWENNEEEAYYVRLLEESGKVIDYILSEKLKIDGEASVKADDAFRIISNTDAGPIVYKTNRFNEITMIDTIAPGAGNEDDTLRLVSKGISGMYRTKTMCFNFALPISVDTKFFVIPNDPTTTDMNEYGCADYTILQNEVSYSNMDSYSFGDGLTADIIVMRENASLSFVIGVVTEVEMALNSDDEAATYFTIQTGGSVVTYPVSEERVAEEIHKITTGSGIDTTVIADATKQLRVSPGDLVKIYKNTAGEIEKISLIYDLDAQTLYSVSPNVADANVTSFDRYIYGEIAEIKNGIVKIKRSSTTFEYYNLKGKTVYIYDDTKSSGNRIRIGMTGDLTEGESILIVSRGGIPNYAFAY